MKTPTPETDSEESRGFDEFVGDQTLVSADFARKLELERDEAVEQRRETDERVGQLLNERDQLRKVADELVTSEKCLNCEDVGWFVEWRRTMSGDPEPEQRQCEFCETNPKSKFKALELYNQLPHVIQRNR